MQSILHRLQMQGHLLSTKVGKDGIWTSILNLFLVFNFAYMLFIMYTLKGIQSTLLQLLILKLN